VGFLGDPGPGFWEEARGLPLAPELGQKTKLLPSTILAIPEGFIPAHGLKPSNGSPREFAIAYAAE